MKKSVLIMLLLAVLGAGLPAEEDDHGFFLELFPTVTLAQKKTVDSVTIHDYFQHEKFWAMGVGFNLYNFEFALALDVFQSMDGYTNNYGFSNLPAFTSGGFDPMNYFIDTPVRGYVEYSNDVFDLSVGRRRWAFGYGEYNMALGRQTPYYDGAWFALHPALENGNRWHYDFLIAADDSKSVENLIDANKGDPRFTSFPNNPLESLDSKLRWFAAHKVGYQAETWQVSVSENMIMYALELGFENLMPIWHNLSRGSFNDSIDIAFEKKFEDFRIYGDLLMDDFTLAHETKGNPNAWGLYFGADLSLAGIEPFQGVRFNNYQGLKSEENYAFTSSSVLSLQAAFASRYLYLRTTGYPLGKFVMHQRVHGGGITETVTGFPYGNDAIMLKASANWSNARWYTEGGLTLLFLGKDNAVKFYTDSDKAIDGLLPGSGVLNTVVSDPNWLFSGIDTVNLIFDPRGYFSITDYLSAYAGLNLRLVLNDISKTNAAFSLGVYLKL
jgi:hypothetical protein